MLLSSPITSFCQDHIILLLIHLTRMLCSHSSSFILSSLASLFKRSVARILLCLFLVQLILTGEASTSILSPKLLVLIIFLVRLAQRTICNLVRLHCIPSFKLFNLSRFVVSLVCRRSNLVLPLLFLFRLSSLDLGARYLVSGGEL